MRHAYLLIAFLLAGVPAAHAYECDAWASASADRFFVNDDGTVTDLDSGLTWMRCSLGQSWNGNTCAGEAKVLPWAAARQQAQQLNGRDDSAGDEPWRVPRLPELASLVDLHCRDPRIDQTLFPNTPTARYWSATNKAGDRQKAYALSFGEQGVTSPNKNTPLCIRLVKGRR